MSQQFTEFVESLVPETLLHSVSWDHRDDVIEITFAERREQVEGAGMAKTIPVERALFLEEIQSIESDLLDLIDEILLYIRNPDARRDRIAKAQTRGAPEPDDDDDDDVE